MKKINEIKTIIMKQDSCVLATALGNRPHCSLMAYVTDENCREIYMATRTNTMKHKNLMENPNVSLLIDTRSVHDSSDRSQTKAITISGIFQGIRDDHQRTSILHRLIGRHPHLEAFLKHPDTAVLRIRITAFLLLDGPEQAHFIDVREEA